MVALPNDVQFEIQYCSHDGKSWYAVPEASCMKVGMDVAIARIRLMRLENPNLLLRLRKYWLVEEIVEVV